MKAPKLMAMTFGVQNRQLSSSDWRLVEVGMRLNQMVAVMR